MESLEVVTNNKTSKLYWYSKNRYIRALIQVIPCFGSSLDTLLSGPGEEWRFKRLEDFCERLNKLFIKANYSHKSISEETKEPMFDLLSFSLDRITKTRSSQKRAYFAQLIFKQVVNQQDWNEAEMASKLLSELSEAHIKILVFAKNVDPCGEPFKGLKVFSIDKHIEKRNNGGPYPPLVTKVTSNTNPSVIKMLCSQLIAQGLLKDEGIGRWKTEAMELFILTKMGEWFLSWILDDNN